MPGELPEEPPGELPVVLVPGMLCDGWLWDGVRGAFTARTVEVIPDAPTLGGMAEQVLDAVDGPFVLVGLSLGAIVGFEVCRRAPERAVALAALSTNAGAPRAEQLAGWRELDRTTAEGGFAHAVETVLPGMFRTPDPGPERAEGFREMARRIGPDRFRAQLAAQATRADALPALAAYHGPVLVLCGGRDALCPPAFHTAIARAAPHARLRRLPGAGHLLPVEEPEATASVLRGWLESAATGVPLSSPAKTADGAAEGTASRADGEVRAAAEYAGAPLAGNERSEETA
ncbi:alpha/beta fold hydrolase [Streptomyces sp. ODS28]|uniref:alpha/beta fold hydrolase n=1 Tax=Streptomyces sp. ODS28 TaxID=3136688 RepID=UPI0031E57E1B